MANEPENEEGGESNEGVVIPEEFQTQTHELLKSATSKHHLSHIRDRVYAKEDEMRKAEMEKEKGKSKGKGKNTPEVYSTEGMPSQG